VTADRSAAAEELRSDGDSTADAKPQTFRSPVAVIVWWVWVLFAVGNLIDIAIQGREHASAVAAAILVFVTGVVYATAQRPKIIAAGDGVTLRNPLRDHRIGWGSITKFDTIDLLRVHCEWPGPDGPRRKVFHAWAVQHSRRREMTRKTREARRSMRSTPFGSPPPVPSTIGRPGTPQTQIGTAQHAVESLKARQETACRSHPPATPPRSVWSWQPIAALVIPALALVIVALT
jgi:Bacterial PH domain